MTREQLIEIAADMAREVGAINVTKDALCERAGVPRGSFQTVMGDLTFSELMGMFDTAGLEPVEVPRGLRANPTLRRKAILASAVHLACRVGYRKITLRDVAEASNVSHTLISQYFDTMDNLRAEIMHAAVEHEIPQLIAQGVAVGDEIAIAAPAGLKRLAGEYILKS